ncbi:MAG TPA: hypothetical protein VGJ36_06370 [Gemmatimonadales bacterium]
MPLRYSGKGRPSLRRIGLAALLICGCQPADRRPAGGKPGSASEPADSLVLSTSDGVEIWFTLARPAKAADGTSCVERALELRRGGTRIPVPLLYTGDRPILISDSMMRAVLWTHCRPMEPYLVDLRNGRPMRERAGRAP